MSKITMADAGSFHSYLPEGCKLCMEGAKMVLFITGLCPKDCFYCPVSEERRADDTYANENKVSCDADVLETARQMDALGTGITGGEPLLKKERVLHYISLLKNEFGPRHHIHLYTSLIPDRKLISKLAQAGLDEIRFHPPAELWDKLESSAYTDSIASARELSVETGFEIPSIRGADKVAAFADKNGCFLNLNELEFSDTNASSMKNMGYVLRNDVSNAAMGSEEYGHEIAGSCGNIHFCSSSYKDAVQLRKRLIRIAGNTARLFDEIGEEGTIFHGRIECDDSHETERITEELVDLEVPADMMETGSNYIDIAWWILEDISEYIAGEKRKLYIVERYPFKKGIIVEKIPM